MSGITAIDTIGAGDNFASGFISALLEGKPLRSARCLPANGRNIGTERGCHNGREKQAGWFQLLDE